MFPSVMEVERNGARMKQFKVTVHGDDTECIVTANNAEEAREKFDNGEIDEWLTPECEQPEIRIEAVK